MSWLRGFCAVAWLVLAVAAQERPRPIDLRETLQRAAERSRAQTELPGDKPPEDRQPDGRGERPGRASRQGQARNGSSLGTPELRDGGFDGGVAKAITWLLVVGTIALLAVAIARAIADRKRRQATLRHQDLHQDTVAPAAPPPLADYEQLAQAGRFADAVHALLLHAFVRLADRRGRGWPKADTGREILAAVGGFAAADASMQVVFHTAEAAWFGARPVDREQYELCLRCFRAWSAA